MLKYFFLLVITVALNSAAFCQKADTTILYFKFFDGYQATVTSLDEADFFRLVIPPDSGDNRYNIKEYYKNGKIKFIGKTYAGPNTFSPTGGIIKFDGDCVSYYQSGRKMSITHYSGGFKDGLEYIFYPSGKLCYTFKYNNDNKIKNIGLKWEFYDKDGNMICENGNGKWVEYERDNITIRFEGSVKQGKMDGEWQGRLTNPDTVRYVYKYNNGNIVSSTGYDRKGNAYPFQEEIQKAHYKSSGLTFIEVLRSHIKIPRDTSGRKMSMDTLHISFVIEKDGHLSGYKILGGVNQQLRDAVFAGLDKINGWTPQKVFGVPFRTELTFPLSEISGFSGNYYVKNVEWKERVLKDN
jgi:antitoxin component YwqK of YwqJK toxin-antitoxin module